MKRPEDIDRILSSLDNVQPAKAPEGFEDEVISRTAMDSRSGWTKWLPYGIAAMIVMAILNVATLFVLSAPQEVNTWQADVNTTTEFYQYLEYTDE